MIERIEKGDREGWLLARGRDVTASQIGALFGVHPYASALELYHQKRRSLPPTGDGESAAMRRGRIFERAAVDMLAEDFPDWDITYNASSFTYFRDPEARLGATPDLIVDAPGRGVGVVQIKTVGAREYRRTWVDEDGEPEAPLWIMLQATLEQYCVGGSWAAIAPLVVGDSFDVRLPIFEVPQTPGLIETMRAKSLAFWADVEAGVEPPADYERDGGLIDRLFAKADGGHEIDLIDDARVAALISARSAAVEARREAARAIDRAEAEIKHIMGDAAVAHLGGGRRIIWRNQRRDGGFTPPSNARVLRVPLTTETDQ